ncbi:sirohydrochlorin chelatase [Paenibacillus nasutitermitis]|uniref:Cobalamin biosynthesis protein CbiX n=1 Tax=Paenibacillus nasutitermitis TaxID=1652958 RepID=A0A917DZR1_9BACL|nr:CbiX/SirB N-terminal domain-containing protein [Paenibacillus nasutitermitis]GGD88154.1 hypothetical protein GCM10010911_53330 [Paenibacillus nasutitermitis]
MRPGVLVISHGSREAQWVQLVDDAVNSASSRVRWRPEGIQGRQQAEGSGAAWEALSPARAAGEKRLELSVARGGQAVPVISSFLEIVGGRLIQDGIDQLEAEGVTHIYVLPLFVSSGSTHVDDIAQAFGLPPVSSRRPGELARFRWKEETRIRFGLPIDDDPQIAGMLLANIRGLSEAPERERLLLVAHGSREAVFHGRWRSGLQQLLQRLLQLGGFAGGDTAMLLPNQAACRLGAMRRKEPQQAVIVVPLFLSEGYFTRTVIPSRLGDLAYRYNGRALLPSPGIAGWMEEQINGWLAGFGENAPAVRDSDPQRFV